MNDVTASAASPTLADNHQRMEELPLADVPFFPRAPQFGRLLSRLLLVAWIVLLVFFFDQLTYVMFNKWLLEAVGLESVFRTNFLMGLQLFVAAAVVFTLAMAAPALLHRISGPARSSLVQLAIIGGLIAGYFFCRRFDEMLLLSSGQSFGETDPVFGNDIGLYIFRLPAYWTLLQTALWCASLALISSVICASLAGRRRSPAGVNRLVAATGRAASAYTIGAAVTLGLLLAGAVWLSRYDVLTRDNYSSTIHSGAQYVDATGFFSTLMHYNITSLMTVGITIALAWMLVTLRQVVVGRATANWGRRVAASVAVVLVLVGLDFAFKAGVYVRDTVMVDPNEPVIQLEYIQRHIDATLKGYGVADVEPIRLIPKDLGDPLPDVEQLLASPTLENLPLWPGFENYIEPVVDPQHADRILLTDGDDMIYGPSLEVFQQQEKLRAYYKFIATDAVRYKIRGDKKMMVSAARELPVNEPYPWLATWGQRHVLYTHGHGLVMASASKVTEEGTPMYQVSGIPSEAADPKLSTENSSVYYGEGSAIWAFSNVRQMKELDYPTDEGRAELIWPEELKAGVHVDSLLKRIIIGWRGGQFFELVFSRLIGPETRVHYNRMPIERLRQIMPFVFLDHNTYAVAAGKRMLWMVNGITHSDQYPYSRRYELGDKSVQRSPYWVRQPFQRVNYVRDAVKATVDAHTGEVNCYQVADEPIVNAWASIYPDLFQDAKDMPDEVREHLQYPLQLFHLQFDDIYNEYHMKEPIYFFNWEDAWDDGDEVLGPILDQGRSITFSMEPAHWIAETDGSMLPKSDDGTQFVLSMPFTSEGAKNIRAIPMAFQDGDDYGRLVCLQVPKTHFYIGPEQADSAIDQEPEISEQISWWNRRGTDVIRGHTSVLCLQGEIIYVEPIFIRSQQNPVTQLKKVIVVFRGKVRMGDTLEQALRLAVRAAGQQATKTAQTEDEEPVGAG